MAQADKPWSTNWRKPACNTTASGVVNPAPCDHCAAWATSPMPKVPTTAQPRPKACKAWANHQAVEVLPLVPVMANTSKALLGWPW